MKVSTRRGLFFCNMSWPWGVNSTHRDGAQGPPIFLMVLFLVLVFAGHFGSARSQCTDYDLGYLRKAGSLATQGPAMTVVTSDSYAYVGADTMGMQIINISDPTNPYVVGSVDTPGKARGITTANGYAYVADMESGLQVVNISDPANPVIVGSEGTPGDAYDVAISGNYAYVANGYSGLLVMDISNPLNPQTVGQANTSSSTEGVVIYGNYAYTAESALGVFDISDPTNPIWWSHVIMPDYDVEDITISGSYIYCANGRSGLQVIDLTSPLNPQLAGNVNTPGYASGVDVSGSFAYIADGYTGLYVIDISDPVNPQISDSLDTPDHYLNVSVLGDFAYITTLGSGLEVIGIDPGNLPEFEAAIPVSDWGYAVAYSNGLIYTSEDGYKLKIFDYTDPDNPAELSSTENWNGIRAVEVQDRICYTLGLYIGKDAQSNAIFYITDCTDPSSPTPRGELWLGSDNWSLDVSGSYAYVTNLNGLSIVDVHNLDAPTVISSLPIPGGAYGCAKSGSYVYLGGWTEGVVVVDVSDPTAPLIVHTVSSATNVFDLTIVDSRAFGAARDNGLIVLDISNPASAFVEGTLPTNHQAYSVVCDGEFAYIADHREGLFVADVSDPTQPTEYLSLGKSGYSSSIAMTPSRVLLKDEAGVHPFIRQCQSLASGVQDLPSESSHSLGLRCSPNPFNPTTSISFDLPVSAPTSLVIYDLTGRRVQTLVREELSNGTHTVVWNGKDSTNRQVASGVYLYRIESGKRFETRRMTLVK